MSTIGSVLLSLIPFVFLIILNILIFRTIKHKSLATSKSSRRQHRDLFVASILILIVLVYAACHSIKVFINIIELFCVITGYYYTHGNGVKHMPIYTIIISFPHRMPEIVSKTKWKKK